MRHIKIISRCCRAWGIQEIDLLGSRKHRPIARARQVLAYLLHEGGLMSYSAIGRALRRDHTTIMSAVRRISSLRAAGDQLTVGLLDQFDEFSKSELDNMPPPARAVGPDLPKIRVSNERACVQPLIRCITPREYVVRGTL